MENDSHNHAEVFVVSKNARSTLWYYVFLVALIVAGVCFTGYFMSYNIKCGAGVPTWVWTRVPPQFECRLAFS